MSSDESRRNAVISAANLLMVSLLKLNRVLVPAMLRSMRSRRTQWIHQASRDVAFELAKDPTRRRLCVGSCCGGPYGSIPELPELSPPSSADFTDADKSSSDAGYGEKTPLNGDATLRVAQNPPDGLSDEAYYRLRVAEEERHRSASANPMVYTSIMQVYFTLLTLLAYSLIIIGAVLFTFNFNAWEAVIFAFTLIATATISESETLLQVRPSPARKRRRAAIAAAREQAGDVAPVMPPPPMPPREGENNDANAAAGGQTAGHGATWAKSVRRTSVPPLNEDSFSDQSA